MEVESGSRISKDLQGLGISMRPFTGDNSFQPFQGWVVTMLQAPRTEHRVACLNGNGEKVESRRDSRPRTAEAVGLTTYYGNA